MIHTCRLGCGSFELAVHLSHTLTMVCLANGNESQAVRLHVKHVSCGKAFQVAFFCVFGDHAGD